MPQINCTVSDAVYQAAKAESRRRGMTMKAFVEQGIAAFTRHSAMIDAEVRHALRPVSPFVRSERESPLLRYEPFDPGA